MVMKGNGNFESERNLREFRENLRENLSSREILEKWKCDENGLPEKTAQTSLDSSSYSDMKWQDCLRQILTWLVFLT